MKSPIIIVGVILAIILLLSGIASAGTTTFTTTADFDGGTKSQSNGNNAVETVTDNPVLTANAIQLASISGDAFTVTDSDASTFKWTPVIGTGGGACSRSISSGFLEIDAVAQGNNAQDCAASTSGTISGAFDVRMKFDWSGTTKVYDFCVIDQQKCNRITNFGTANGILIDNLVGGLQPYKVVSGTMTSLASATTVNDNPLWLRISRSTNAWTFYHSTDGSSWTTDFGSPITVTGIPTSLYVLGNLVDNNYVLPMSLKIDSYQMTAGTVDSGGYIGSGTWTSASQSAITDAFRSITVDYSSATASNFITSVYLVDSTSHYFFIDNTDLTSGSSHTYTFSAIDSNTWKVGFNLTGGGGGTVNVADISVTFSETAPTLTVNGQTPTTSTYATSHSFYVIYTDADNDAPTFIKLQIVGGSNRTLTGNNSGDTTYTDGKAYFLTDPANTYCPGTHSYFFSTSDGVIAGIRTTTQTFTVTNTAPVISNGASAPTQPNTGSSYSFDFNANDIDVPDCQTFTWSFVGAYPSWLSINSGSGMVSGSVPNTPGTPFTFTVRVSDGTAHNDFAVSGLIVGPVCGFNNVGLGNLTLLFAIIVGAGILAFVVGALKIDSGGLSMRDGIPVKAFAATLVGFVVVVTIAVVIMQNLRCG